MGKLAKEGRFSSKPSSNSKFRGAGGTGGALEDEVVNNLSGRDVGGGGGGGGGGLERWDFGELYASSPTSSEITDEASSFESSLVTSGGID